MKTLWQPILFIRCLGSVKEIRSRLTMKGLVALLLQRMIAICMEDYRVRNLRPKTMDSYEKNAQIAGPLASGGTGNRPVGKRQRAAYSGV